MTTINHKPTSVDHLILPDAHTTKRVSQYASGKRHGNIILHGPKGTGRTTAAEVITDTRRAAANSSYPVPAYNGATFNDSMFDRIYNEWQWQQINGVEHPYVIINEVDKLSISLQHKLRAILDSTEIGNVILTTNNIHSIDEPLVDRCDDILFPPINIDDWHDTAVGWLTDEGITVDDDVLKEVLSTNNGTIRDLKRAIEDIICEHK